MRIGLFLLFALFGFQHIYGQLSLGAIKTKWKQKKYTEVIDQGSRLRETLMGKGIPALDYMILSSICMIADPRTGPCSDVLGILKDYYSGLPKKDYELMETGFDRICRQNTDPDLSISDKLPSRQYVHIQRSATTTSRFKTYMLITEGLKKEGIFRKIDYNELANIVETATDSLQTISDQLIEIYTKRRISKKDTAGIKRAMARFGANSKYSATEHFLVITTRNSYIEPKVVATNMEKVLTYFKNAFELYAPDDYITIYLAPQKRDVRTYIGKLYTSKTSFSPLGFSNFYDNSILAWLYSSEAVGTIKHELIHLLLRYKFNFTPVWFEEGLATLYEESRFDSSSSLQGKPNWRGVLLKETPALYTLGDLFSNKENDYSRTNLIYLREQYKRQIQENSYRDENLRWLYRDHHMELDEVLSLFLANRIELYKDALARNFFLFLQERKKINQLFQAILQRDRASIDTANYQTLEAVILKVCEVPTIADLERAFYDWLHKTY